MQALVRPITPSSLAPADLVAVTVTVVAVTASLPLQRTFDRFPYLPLLVAAVIISAWIGGLGPVLLAAGGGAVVAEYLVMGGLHAVDAYPELLAQLTLFVAVAAIATSIRGSRTRVAAIRRNRLLWELQERVKELTLLRRATSLLQEDKNLEAALRQLIGLLPAAWQFPELLEARITVANLAVATPGFRITPGFSVRNSRCRARRRVSWKLSIARRFRSTLVDRSFPRNEALWILLRASISSGCIE